MKAVILAGGAGVRMGSMTTHLPKPMVDIGGRPLLWHLMESLASQGVDEFILALGYKSEVIKQYFLNYRAIHSNLTVQLRTGDITIHEAPRENWQVTLVETGAHTGTGGRLKRLAKYIGEEDFLFTYGDGLSDIDLRSLAAFHRSQGRMATVTAVRRATRYGELMLDRESVLRFREKPPSGWINGGFFILRRSVLDYIEGDQTVWEQGPMERLAREGELSAFRHFGFWASIDTPKEHEELDRLWREGLAPWKPKPRLELAGGSR